MIMGRYSIPVWQMIVQTISSESPPDNYLPIPEIIRLVTQHFPDENVNPRTVELQTIFHCVNHQQNRHGGGLHESNPLFETNERDEFRLIRAEMARLDRDGFLR